MLIYIFVLAFLSYLIHGYTWIQYCEAYTKRAYILNGFVNCDLLIRSQAKPCPQHCLNSFKAVNYWTVGLFTKPKWI